MTSISLRMDENLKQQFDAVCSELGLSMTTAFTIFAKATVRKQGIPFDVVIGDNAAQTHTEKKLLEAQTQAASTQERKTLHEVLHHARSAIHE